MAYNESNFGEDNLQRIKDNIATAYCYFEDNYKRYRDFRQYVFKESVTEDQRAVLKRLNRPCIEFNILEAYVSRLKGEFAMQEPSISAMPEENQQALVELSSIIEGHIRHIKNVADKDSFSDDLYQDELAGGFSVAECYTDFASPMSFDQQIKWRRVFDPTLCGFDPLARQSHKGDGDFCFEIFPMLIEDFKRKFPDQDVENLNYMVDIEGFSWSYSDQTNRKVLLFVRYFEKKKKKTKIVKLANGRTMTLSNYRKMERFWQEQQYIEQIPVIVKQRTTELETICFYELIENRILTMEVTDYNQLPYVFFDGNSINLTKGKGRSTYQMTRPYVYHAKGIQDLKNFAGQTLANYLQNMVQHKFIVMKEAIPQEKDYLEALSDIQRMNTVVVNAYSENNPDKPIPNPIREVQNLPAPPEVMGAFQMTDPTTQTILGSFASNLGRNDQDLSGKAVIETASVGNAASMPYVMGYLAGLTQLANITASLMPKRLIGKRMLPLLNAAKEQEYKEINGPGLPTLDYDDHSIKINITAGVNFQVQKNQALQQITSLMQASQEFAAFMNDDETLPILVDNLTIYGADRLKEAVPKWIAKKQQMQQQAQQMQQQAMMQDPRMIKAQADMQKTQLAGAELQAKQQQQQFENQMEIAKRATEDKLADAKILEAEAKVSQAQIDSAIRLEESNTSLERHALDAAAKLAEVKGREHDTLLKTHQAHLEERKLQHEINKAEKESNNVE